MANVKSQMHIKWRAQQVPLGWEIKEKRFISKGYLDIFLFFFSRSVFRDFLLNPATAHGGTWCRASPELTASNASCAVWIGGDFWQKLQFSVCPEMEMWTLYMDSWCLDQARNRFSQSQVEWFVWCARSGEITKRVVPLCLDSPLKNWWR